MFPLGILRYLRSLARFRMSSSERIDLLPCLHDWYEEGGETRSEYFWQDLLVAKMIHEANPQKHVDIGSRVDGFVAHVASFREIEVFDVRNVSATIPGVVFRRADLMKSLPEMRAYCDSLSCLHALEHFGLGRYGDPLSPLGYISGLANMADLLKPGGQFYLSVPIGIPRVEFNAHRIFDPQAIIRYAGQNSLRLSSFTAIHAGGRIEQYSPETAPFSSLGAIPYSLGVFTFMKL
ncbi:MAG: DUF268 domain-containing protein [Elusimicrobiales bacterium]|nr:DUF268 domain-containing protein [Elusimicrobiales bacterium]